MCFSRLADVQFDDCVACLIHFQQCGCAVYTCRLVTLSVAFLTAATLLSFLSRLASTFIPDHCSEYLGQSIQEWTK